MRKLIFPIRRVVLTLTFGLIGFLCTPLCAQDGGDTEKPAAPAKPALPSSKTEAKALIKERKKQGGIVYEEYATVIHTKRLRSEFTPAQWKTILLQKRIRVPFTAQDHRDILLFFVGE